MVFAAPNVTASENSKLKYCNFFLQYCYSAILSLELHYSTIVKPKTIFYSVPPSFWLSLPLSVSHRCWVLDFGGWISVDRQAGFGSVGWDRLMVGLDRLIDGLKRWICWSVGGSIGLIINSFDGGSGDDFFWMGLLRWRCFSFGLVLVLVLLGIFADLGFKLAAWISDWWLGYF